MPLLKEKQVNPSLYEATEMDLLKELWNRDISLEYIQGAYYAMGEQENYKLETIFGSSERGLHGRDSDKPKSK